MRPPLALLVALVSSACDRNRWVTSDNAGSLDATAIAAPMPATSTPTQLAPDVVTLASAAPVAPSPRAAPMDSGVSIDLPVTDVTVRVDARRDAVLLATTVDAEDAGVDAGAEATVATVLPVLVPVFVPTAALPEIPSATPVSPVVSPAPPLGATGTGGSLVTRPPPLDPSVAGGVLPFPAQPPPVVPMPAGGASPLPAQPGAITPSIAGGSSTIGAPPR